MRTFLHKFSSALSVGGASLGQIFHLGPGESSDFSDYDGLSYGQLILIEGDPDVAEKLAAHYEGAANVSVMSSLVAATNGPRTFYRFNLPFLNGPLPLGDLRRIYPRLQEMDQLSIDASLLGEMLHSLPAEEDQRSLLILDVPGQESEILSSLMEGDLARFEWILLHGAGESLQLGSQAISSSITTLENLGYREFNREEGDPQWPLVLLRRDPAASILKKRIREQEQLIIELTQERHLLADSLSDLKSATSSILNERDATIAALEEELETQKLDEAARVQALEERLTSLGEDLSAKTELLSQKEILIQEQTGRLAELESQLLEFREQSAEVTRQRDELQSAQALLNEELEKRARLLVEKATQIHQQGERIGELERVLTESSAQRDDLQAQANEVTRQRDELQSTHAVLNEELENRAQLLVEKATQIHQQGERIAELERVLGEVSAHRDGLQGEVAELTRHREKLQSSQANLIEELENRARILVEKTTQIHQQGERIAEAERHFGEVSAHRDSLSAERDGMAARIVGLESQIADQDQRQKQIVAQLSQGETQLEMLKELMRPTLS